MKSLSIILFILFSTNIVAQTNNVVDTDGNGLIEINDLETLNAIRYQMDGTSYKATAEVTTGSTAGCPDNRCMGYELTRDLDFNDDDSYSSTTNKIIWTTGAGWQPIGDSFANAFRGEFKGNGFTIYNLTIARGGMSGIGLFGYTGSEAKITNVDLLGVDIIGDFEVGGLVGFNNRGTITNSYATGSVSGDRYVGGLVGYNLNGIITNSYAAGSVSANRNVGGLVGRNVGTITNSYAAGSVSGVVWTGGLVGYNLNGIITNSYATGAVSGDRHVGGLVGRNRSTITNSYATGAVSGDRNVGGLVGDNRNGIVTNSYWDINTSGIVGGADGRGKTTLELKAESAQHTDPDKPYYQWSATNWYFGTGSQYPILKYTDNPETVDSECRGSDDTTTDLPVCGSLLSPTLRYGLSELQLVEGDLSPDFDVVVPNYKGMAVNSISSTIQFRPITVNPDAKVYITANGERGMAIESGDESSIISLNTGGITTIIIDVENGGETTQTITYTLYLNYYEFNGDVDRDDDGLIEVDSLEGLNAVRYQPDGTGYRESETALKISVGCPNNVCRGYELTKDLDFNDPDSYDLVTNRITWTTGAGWQPIGDSSNAFSSQFSGNGFTISNLTIDRSGTGEVGLFGHTSSGAQIAGVVLLNVDIVGDFDVGGLVGWNEGTITNSYATGSVLGGVQVGGLVGFNNRGSITNSYATDSASGVVRIGGLVGWNEGTIMNSYATGSVSGVVRIGGLVGFNNRGSITNSYATGFVSEGGSNIGGLVGFNRDSTITNSYWDVNTSGIRTSAGGTGKTTVELKAETAQDTDPDKSYYRWSTTNWYFGTDSQYPILKYTDNSNEDSSECRTTSIDDTTTNIPVCGSLLSPGDGLKELQLVEGDLSPDFDVGVPSYRGTVVSSASTIQFRPITVNPDAKVYIMANEETRGVAIESGDESGIISLNTDGITTITIDVENGGETTQTFMYTLSIDYYEFNGDVDRDDDGLIEIDNLEGLNAMHYQPDGTGYRESETTLKVSVGCPNSVCRGYELTRDLDFNDDESYSSTANRITWTKGAGWQPIGDSFSNAFRGVFEGNGFTISNLMITRGTMRQIGLFGYTGSEAKITNVGLLNVDIIGDLEVGGLVGLNRGGTITQSYATGSVSGVVRVGGLVGWNEGTITNSYSISSVSGDYNVGGLVGINRDGAITNSYAVASVSGDRNVGGLVGTNIFSIITNSYAMGSVSGDYNVGGLIGINNGYIMNSYWDVNTSGIQASAGGEGKTTRALQELTRATGIYRGWSDEVWDFGTTKQYPALKYSDGTVILNQGRMPVSIRINVRVFLEGFMPEHKN